MPHLHLKSFHTLPFPVTHDGVRFDGIAHNVGRDDEKLIAAHCEGRDFFLLLKTQTGKFLLKADKLTRPSPTFYVKKALKAYVAAAGLEVLAGNVDDAPTNPHLNDRNALWNIRDFAERFPTDKPVRIEVGFGSGRHLLHQAKQHPDRRFIGIEIHKPSIEQVLKQINIAGLDNLLLLDYDARLFLELVPSNLVERIYVHFPVPWDKKPHRRVISPDFVGESIRALAPGGKLELRTDSDNYFAYSFETFMQLSNNHVEIFKNRRIEVSSKYEDRWRRMEKNIYDIVMHNEASSPPLALDGTFDFDTADRFDETRLASLSGRTLRFNGGFVHFERFYRFDDGRFMFRLSMGPFERPEHLYLTLGDAPAYFPTPPVRTKTTLEAHRQLQKALHG